MLNTVIVTNQPTFPMNCFAERKPYKTDPFTLIDGRYVGHDGFVVPTESGVFVLLIQIIWEPLLHLRH